VNLLLLEALQLQRNFGLLNEFLPLVSVFDAVLPVVYSHVYYITFYIILPPVLFGFLLFLSSVLAVFQVLGGS
jgi:hypothetical protein